MKKIKLLLLSLLAVCIFFTAAFHTALTSPLLAYFVIPSAYTNVAGGAGFLGPLSSSQRTYQLLVRDSILTGLAGQELTAITWRLLPAAASTWPASDVNFTNFDIYLSGSVAPENRSLTFSQNIVGVQKRVRSGPLTITAGSFPFGSNPNNFGTDITFDSAYVYNGGHLLIELRHTGHNGSSSSVDAAGTSTPGYGYLYSALWASSYTATSTTTQGNAVITRVNHRTPLGVSLQTELVKEFSLSQNYPNPFNPSTNIEFSMPKSGIVTLKLYNASGSEVKTLINGANYPAGVSLYIFNATGLASGIYFYTMLVDGIKVDTKRMILVK